MRFFFWLGVLAALIAGPTFGQTAPGHSAAADDDEPTQVDDVIVSGQSTRRAADAFVESVGQAPQGRNLAVWRNPICVTVNGMRPDAALAMADRVLDWANWADVPIGSPRCKPNVIILAAEDGPRAARDLVSARRLDFQTKTSGSTAGTPALDRFQNAPAPIRWWHVSLPMNIDTGLPTVRLHGQPPWSPVSREIRSPADVGPMGSVVSGSRLINNTRDEMLGVIIIVESSALETASFSEIADFVSLVALAQINPDAELMSPSILTLFQHDREPGEKTWTEWDQAFIRSLYTQFQSRSDPASNRGILAAGLVRDLERTSD